MDGKSFKKLTEKAARISFTFVAVYLPLHRRFFHVECLKLFVNIAKKIWLDKNSPNDTEQPDESNRSANCKQKKT
jgi:hypothetical protein